MKNLKLVILLSVFALIAYGSSIDRIAYQGRLLQATGAPIAGPVDLTFKVYLNAVATIECSQTVSAVALSQGIFNVELTFPGNCTGATKTISQFMIDAADNSDSVYIEITDDTNVKTYGKQMFTASTYAMVAKAVVSESISNTSLLGMSANCANGEIVQTDGLGNFYCGDVNSSLVSGIDAVLLADGSVNDTEYQYLANVTSDIQAQLNSKQVSGSYQPLDADLTDLADGSLSGSKVGTGINAANITAGTLSNLRLDSDLQDLADGSLTTTKIAPGTINSTEFGYLNGITGNVQTQINDKGVPTGAVMSFNLASCPAGWSELTAARGRVVVGKPSGGTLAGTVGTALTNMENRAVGQHNHGASSGDQSANHTHTANHSHTAQLSYGTFLYGKYSAAAVNRVQAVTSAGYDIAGTNSVTVNATNVTTSGISTNHNHAITVNNSGNVIGTNAPYIQLLICQKN